MQQIDNQRSYEPTDVYRTCCHGGTVAAAGVCVMLLVGCSPTPACIWMLISLVICILVFKLFYVHCFTDKRWEDPGFFSCKRAERPPDLPGPREGPFAWIWALYRIPEEVRGFV